MVVNRASDTSASRAPFLYEKWQNGDTTTCLYRGPVHDDKHEQNEARRCTTSLTQTGMGDQFREGNSNQRATDVRLNLVRGNPG